ncbi:DUF4249 domain-containing protein [Spirosoma radiotolerans]|uniref:DUF4249 domain-containing protein n=1 Tax=Spirosoma radiotolerans TaxID=1379870 RepID=A0A0E3ZZ00_9BACT|nr:DUF4249 domain-containing protein [Spirosoma radiotolerans]AKD57753.1 hypothetical protein SD10_25515 [Spirosoma radiotolerans]
MHSFTQLCTTLNTCVNGLTVALLLSGCSSLRNEVDPSQLGLASPKLVISGYLSPQDTTLAIKVIRSNTVVGDSLSQLQTGNDITDATVTLSDGNKSVQLQYTSTRPTDSTRQSYYSASAQLLPILAGRTYKLSVVTANGQRASSTCTIPAPVKLKSITFDSLTQNQGRSLVRRYFIKALWTDPARQDNFYQLVGYFRYRSKLDQIGNFPLTYDDDNRGLLTDEGLDGTVLVSGRSFLTSTTFKTNESTSFYGQYQTASVTVNLMSVEQTYYRFQEAVIRQRRVRNNPFAEPVLIPSNIEGGLGCFAGYNNATTTFTLK